MVFGNPFKVFHTGVSFMVFGNPFVVSDPVPKARSDPTLKVPSRSKAIPKPFPSLPFLRIIRTKIPLGFQNHCFPTYRGQQHEVSGGFSTASRIANFSALREATTRSETSDVQFSSNSDIGSLIKSVPTPFTLAFEEVRKIQTRKFDFSGT